MDKSAKQDKVPLTERKQYVYMMPIYGMEVTRLTSGGLTDVFMWKKKTEIRLTIAVRSQQKP